MILTPRDWQAFAQYQAIGLLGTHEGAEKLVEAARYGMLADALEQQHRDIERLSVGVKIRIPTDTMEQEIAAHVRRAVAAERERCSKEFVENGRAIGRAEERERCAKQREALMALLQLDIEGVLFAATGHDDILHAILIAGHEAMRPNVPHERLV